MGDHRRTPRSGGRKPLPSKLNRRPVSDYAFLDTFGEPLIP
jgi:hypothetical protein